MPSGIDYSVVAHQVMYDNIHNGPLAAAVMEEAHQWRRIGERFARLVSAAWCGEGSVDLLPGVSWWVYRVR